MIPWGALLRAIYLAWKRSPSNANVAHSVRKGLQHAVPFHSSTPRDVLEWLRDYHNKWHKGSATTCLEILTNIGPCDASWRAHCITERITSRSCGKGENSLRARNWAWLQEIGRSPMYTASCTQRAWAT